MSLSKKIDLQKNFASGVLSEFKFIDWRYSQSCWYFLPSFLNCCPSRLLSGSTLAPPPSQWISTVYSVTVCKGGGVWGSGPQTDNHLPQSPFTGQFFTWRHFALPSMSLIFLLSRITLYGTVSASPTVYCLTLNAYVILTITKCVSDTQPVNRRNCATRHGNQLRECEYTE
jgi:hypothetical protein